MPRTLSDGKIKFTILTAEPEDPEAPTPTELNAGIQCAPRILQEGFTWSPGDSEKIAEKALADVNNANAIGAGNYTAGFTFWRYFDDLGAAETLEDVIYPAVKERGTELWCYARETGKDADAAWADGDEIYLGAKVITDSLQRPEGGGFIKRRLPLEVQSAWENIEASAAA